MVWVDQWTLGLRPLLALHPPLSPLTHHRDNVTAPHGHPNLRSRLSFCHAQEGGPRSPQKDMWWHWGGKIPPDRGKIIQSAHVNLISFQHNGR